MSTNWVVPTAASIGKVLNLSVLVKSNENIDDATVNGQLAAPDNVKPFDSTLDDRATEQVNMAVAQFRGAIQLCGRQPLSLTEGSVPPEVEKHVLSIAAYGLVNSTPNLQMVIMNDKGIYSPLIDAFKSAEKYLEAIIRGRVVVPPNDPTGRDYQSAINIPWFSNAPNPYPEYDANKPLNPPVEPVRFGANSRPVDLTTYDGIFQHHAPAWWPAEDIGQP